jgi:hypothetical protein
MVPSSPGEKVKHEQKPSDEVMRRVRPSVDLWTVSKLET